MAANFWIYVATWHHEVLAIDGQTGQMAATFPVGALYNQSRSYFEHPLAVSPDGRRLYVADMDADQNGDPTDSAGVVVIDTDSQNVVDILVTRVDDAAAWSHLAVSPDGRLLYLVGSQNEGGGVFSFTVIVLEVTKGDVVTVHDLSPSPRAQPDSQYHGATDAVYQVAIGPANTSLYLGLAGPYAGVSVLNLITGEMSPHDPDLPRSGKIPGGGGRVIRSSGGMIYALSGAGDRLLIIDPVNQQIVEHLPTESDEGSLPHFFIEMVTSPAEDSLYLLGTCTYGGGLNRLDLATGDVLALARDQACGYRLDISPDGQYLVAAAADSLQTLRSSILVIDASTGQVVRRFPLEGILDLAVAPMTSAGS